jgi:hypothetical protein
MDGRAQTSIDFAIAMGVFLVALTTVVAFMPTMTSPFTSAQDDPLTADRLASQAVSDQLGDPTSPSILNVTCTRYFFNGTAGDPCDSFDATNDVAEKLGAGDEVFVNVSVRTNHSGDAAPDIVCGLPDGTVSEPPCSGDEVHLAAGEEPPGVAGSVTIARRYAVYGQDGVYVVVNVWT